MAIAKPIHVWKCIKIITPKNIRANDKANITAHIIKLSVDIAMTI